MSEAKAESLVHTDNRASIISIEMPNIAKLNENQLQLANQKGKRLINILTFSDREEAEREVQAWVDAFL